MEIDERASGYYGPVKIDLLDPKSFEGGQPHEQLRWLRRHAPVYRHDEPDGPGFWVVSRYEDVRAIGRNPADFSSQPTIMIADAVGDSALAASGVQMMLTMDPPGHTRYRRILSRAFTPRAAAALAPRIGELARQIVDGVIERGLCEFVSEVAGELPSYVIAELIGIPLDDGRKLYELTEQVHAAPETLPPGAGPAAALEIMRYGQGVIEHKRREPGDDLATRLLQAEVEGERLSDLEFQLFFLLLIDAGGDTTRNLAAGGVLALLERPELLAALRDDPGRIPGLREEMLRWVSPVVYMRRTATRDLELGGQRVRSGDKVVLYYGSANRDEAVFEDPERFDPDRAPNPHLAFGAGTHFCLGAHVARVEIDALLGEVLPRMRDLSVDGPVEWQASNFISGPKRMPVRFTPGAPLSAV